MWRIECPNQQTTIVVAARNSYTTIEHDIREIDRGFAKQPDTSLPRARSITLDGEKGAYRRGLLER